MRYLPGPDGYLSIEGGGRVGYFPALFRNSEVMFERLKTEIQWERKTIVLFGKEVMQPRGVAYMADHPSLSYTYSGQTLVPESYSPTVLGIKIGVEQLLGKSFNCVLLNYYETGMDHMGWHSDNEKLFGEEPVIASVSLGTPRAFDLKRIGKDLLQYRSVNVRKLIADEVVQVDVRQWGSIDNGRGYPSEKLET